MSSGPAPDAAAPGELATSGNYTTDPHDLDRADNPTVVEFGVSPLRVTIPLTTPEREREAARWSAAMIVGTGVFLYFGGAWLKDLVRELRS